MRIAAYDSLANQAAAASIGSVTAAFEQSVSWLKAEEGRVTSAQRYLIARQGKETLAWAACYAVPHDAAHTTYATRSLLLGSATAKLTSQLAKGPRRSAALASLDSLRTQLAPEDTDTLAVIVPGSSQPGIAVDRDVTGPRRAEAVKRLIEHAEALAEEKGLPIVEFGNVRDEPRYSELHQLLMARGYTPVITGADAVLDVDGTNLDAYFDAFRSNRRKVLRKERRGFLALNPITTLSGANGLTDDLLTLQLDHYRRHGHTTSPSAVRDRFDRAASIPGIRVLRTDAADTGILGFLAFYEDPCGKRIIPRFGAFASEPHGCYFNIGYYELISYASKVGGASIHYGETTYQAKIARGCRLTRLTTYFRSINPHSQRLLSLAGELRTGLEEGAISAASAKTEGSE